MLQLYLDNRKEIRSILTELAPKLPSYHSLEWRLDVQVRVKIFIVLFTFGMTQTAKGNGFKITVVAVVLFIQIFAYSCS